MSQALSDMEPTTTRPEEYRIIPIPPEEEGTSQPEKVSKKDATSPGMAVPIYVWVLGFVGIGLVNVAIRLIRGEWPSPEYIGLGVLAIGIPFCLDLLMGKKVVTLEY